MKKYLILICLISVGKIMLAQETVYPAPAQKEAIAITNATIHVGNGTVITNGAIVFNKGKITYVGEMQNAPSASKTIDAKGKHVYPSLILSITNLGLMEIPNGARPTHDFNELGEMNSNIRSIVAYNTDSKVTGTLRANGILLANIVPQGSLIGGSSSLVQLDAWNWEDAAYKMDVGIHFYMPALFNRPNPFAALFGLPQPVDAVKQNLEKIETVKAYFREAKAYLASDKHEQTNLKFEALKGLFNKKQKFFIHCDIVREILVAIDFVKEFGFDVVIVGGSESWQIADLIKQNNMAVILGQSHSLPVTIDDDVDQPFKTPAMLQKAGVLFAINDEDGQTRGRNIMYNAGTAATYGLSKEEALASITLNAAKILGVDNITGSLETGKDANIVISDGDLLDMKSSGVAYAFIQGRMVSLDNKQKQLYERYKYKYGLK